MGCNWHSKKAALFGQPLACLYDVANYTRKWRNVINLHKKIEK